MKRLRMASLALSLALLVSCTPRAGEEQTSLPTELPESEQTPIPPDIPVATGRYLEEEWPLPEDPLGVDFVSGVLRQPDGRFLALLTAATEPDVQFCYSTLDGADWRREEPDWLVWAAAQGHTILDLTGNSRGYVAFSYRDEDGEVGVAVSLQGEGLREISLEGADGDGEWEADFSLRDMVLDDDGTVYLGSDTVPVAFPPDGGPLRRLVHPGNALATSGDWLIQGVYRMNDEAHTPLHEPGVALYRLGSDEAPQLIPCDQMAAGSRAALATSEDGSIYLVNKRGIFHRTPGGSIWEKVLDGSITSLEVSHPNRLFYHGDGEFLVYASPSRRLYNYKYSAEVPAVAASQLTLYSPLGDSDALSQAVYAFSQTHPNVSVQVTDPTGGDAAALFDTAEAILLELRAGGGPDLLMLEALPTAGWLGQGLLTDLSGWLRPMLDSGEVLPGVAGAYAQDGKIEAVTARFLLRSVWGNADAAAACTDLTALADYAQANPDKQLLHSARPGDLLAVFYDSCRPAWTADTGAWDEAALEAFFTDCKRIFDTAGNWREISLYEEGDAWARGDLELVRQNIGSFIYLWHPVAALAAFSDVSDQAALVRSSIVPIPGQARGVFFPSMVVGVNAGSPQQELAQEFVRCMLSEEVQSRPVLENFPVLIKVLQDQIAEADDDTFQMDIDGIPLTYGKPSPQAHDVFLERLYALEVPVLRDTDTYRAVLEQLELVCSGQASPREAAAAVAGGEQGPWTLPM